MIESEIASNRERIETPKYEGVLLHGYWMSKRKGREVELSEKSGFIAYCAELLTKNGIATDFVIPIGHLWGDKNPALNQLMVKKMTTSYSIKKENIIAVGDARNTKEEIEEFLKVAVQKGLKNLANVAFYPHFWSMQEAELKHGIEPIYAEALIFKYGSPDMKRKLLIHTLKYGASFAVYNALKSMAGKSEKGSQLMDDKSHEDRIEMGPVEPIHSVDGYVIEES